MPVTVTEPPRKRWTRSECLKLESLGVFDQQPDLIVLRSDYSAFRSATPQPQDLRLVVEVADTTLAFDLGVKAALYARAGIVEYWVLDVSGRRLVVHRDPQAGQYQSIVAYSEQESVAPLSAPDSPFRIADAFPE